MTTASPVTSSAADGPDQVWGDLYCLSWPIQGRRAGHGAGGSQWAGVGAGTPRPPVQGGRVDRRGGGGRRPASGASAAAAAAAHSCSWPPAPSARVHGPSVPGSRAPVTRLAFIRRLSAPRDAGDSGPATFILTCRRPVSAPCQIIAAKLVSRRTSKLPQ